MLLDYSTDYDKTTILALKFQGRYVWSYTQMLKCHSNAINGFELYEKIREINSKVKACFITAYEVYY